MHRLNFAVGCLQNLWYFSPERKHFGFAVWRVLGLKHFWELTFVTSFPLKNLR